MAENPFRILLDFRELNFKFYKFVWMSISPRELVTIKDLKDAILKKFSFERTDLLLFLRDGLLPEDENISIILRENDSIRLFYAEPLSVNLNDSKTINYDCSEENTDEDQVKSPKKRKEHSDISEDSEEKVECNKKRKHSFSNGTYSFKNITPENSAVSAVSGDIENVSSADLYNFENGRRQKSCKIKKKLKYTHDVSQNSLVSENEMIIPSDIIAISGKNESKVNSCKKKKKHKHSKDVSENEFIVNNDIVRMSKINKDTPGFHKKKKKRKHSCDVSKMASVSAVAFHDEVFGSAEKFNHSLKELDTRNELTELNESHFETVTDESELLKLIPVSFCASSIGTSSGIGHSLKTSQESNQKISLEQNCSPSYVPDSKPISETEDNNLSGDQGNNSKKKKRKRRRKRKSLLISPEVDVSNDCNLDVALPQKNDNLNSLFASALYQTAEISPKSKEISDNSNSNGFHSKRNANCLPTKSFIRPFGSYLSSTSTPFSLTRVASPSKNVISKMQSSSNVSKDKSCSVTTSVNTILPALHPMDENSLSAQSLPCIIPKNKDNSTVPNHNFHEKSLPTKINNSDKTTDSFSDVGAKSQFLDPSLFYKGCPPLNSCPLVGTRIAYKMLELDASYSPVVSDYKEGVVKAVNSQTDELEIELIQPEVKEARIGKFENLYEDEWPPSQVIRKVTLSWPSLIDPVRVVC